MAKKKSKNEAADAVRAAASPRYGKSRARVDAERKIVKRYEDGSAVTEGGQVWDPDTKRFRAPGTGTTPKRKAPKRRTTRHYGSA